MSCLNEFSNDKIDILSLTPMTALQILSGQIARQVINLFMSMVEKYVDTLPNNKQKTEKEKIINIFYKTCNNLQFKFLKSINTNTGTLLINAGKRYVYSDFNIFNSIDVKKWEHAYNITIDNKYKKNTRSWNKTIHGIPDKSCKEASIYVIPRERGGPSYKNVNLDGCDSKNLQYCLISKGFGMQDVSSFTLGPIVGHGLCLVNSAFSKVISVHHIEGKVNLKRKNFWQSPRTLKYKITNILIDTMKVNNKIVNIKQWLQSNEHLWLGEWTKWSKHVALCSMGDFHWGDKSDTIGYRVDGKYVDFKTWKKEAYIRSSYDLLSHTKAYKFLKKVFDMKIPLGLVHPKARNDAKEYAITKEYIRELYDSDEMCCQPYVIAGKLLNVEI